MTESKPSTTIIVQQGDSNTLGVVGFVLSLLAFFTCGLLSPLGAALSFFGMFSRPRGLAIAGFMLGIIGSTWLFLAGFAMIVATLGWGSTASDAREAAREATRAAATSQVTTETTGSSDETHRRGLDKTSTRELP